MIELKPCGTPAAYKRHLRAGEIPCDACREAQQISDRDRYLAVRQPKPKQPTRRERHRRLIQERRARFEADQAELERRRSQSGE